MESIRFTLTIGMIFIAFSSCAISACGASADAPYQAPLVAQASQASTIAQTSAPVPVSTPAIKSQAQATSVLITDVKIQSTSSTVQTNVPVTFGQIFAQGEVTAQNTISGTLGDGSNIPLQINIKATHPDGSLRHGIISTIIPTLSPAQHQTLQLKKITQTSASPSLTPPQDLINSGFTATAKINLAGLTYSATVNELLKTGKYISWLAGPVANEWLVSMPLKNNQGIEHPHLAARFAIRSFTGIGKAKVDVTIENAWAYEPAPQNFTYDVQIFVGGQSVYEKTALTHYHHARWHKSFWWGDTPQIHIKHNIPYLIASKALPNYDQSIVISSAALTALRTGFSGAKIEPMQPGIAQPYMPATGGRADIGLLPGWAATYLLSMDKDAKIATLGMGDLAGSWSIHYRDKNTKRPVSLSDYPYMTILGTPGDTYNPATKRRESFPICGGICANSNIADAAHEPSFAYLPYLITGDNYYLEELQFWTMWNAFKSNPGYRENAKGLLHQAQVRDQAWSMRTLANAAYITPDSDPFKAQFETILSNNLDYYNKTYTNNMNINNLGILSEDGAIIYNNKLGIAPWQDDFFTSAIGNAAELGYTKAAPLLAWKAKFPISRMTDVNFCWIFGSIYSLNIRATATSSIYASIGPAYLASQPSQVTSLRCGSSEMAKILGLKPGEMLGYSSDSAGFPSNMQPALAYSVDSGVRNGANAWAIFAGRSVKPDYQNSPQFAIIPR